MWKRNVPEIRKLEAEAANVHGSGSCTSTLMIHIERQNLNVVQFLKKYTVKSECLIDHHLQRNIFKSLRFT